MAGLMQQIETALREVATHLSPVSDQFSRQDQLQLAEALLNVTERDKAR